MSSHCKTLPCAESFDPEDDMCVCPCAPCVAYVHRVQVATGLIAPSRLTARQAEVLAFIVGHIDAGGFPPTARDVMRHFGWSSTTAVTDHLRAIERKGWIAIAPHKARGIKVLVRPQGAT